jgi:hypothetical protein
MFAGPVDQANDRAILQQPFTKPIHEEYMLNPNPSFHLWTMPLLMPHLFFCQNLPNTSRIPSNELLLFNVICF